MKNKILEIQNFFKSELLKGNFEILKIKTGSVKLSIDGYIFTYHYNIFHPKTLKQFLLSSDMNFIELPELNEDEKQTLYFLLYNDVDRYNINECETPEEFNEYTDLKNN